VGLENFTTGCFYHAINVLADLFSLMDEEDVFNLTGGSELSIYFVTYSLDGTMQYVALITPELIQNMAQDSMTNEDWINVITAPIE